MRRILSERRARSLFILALGFVAGNLTSKSAFASDPIYLKTGREIYASYQTIMNVDGSAAELRSLYKLNADRLPKDGVVGELSSSTVLAATELSGAFCKTAVANEKQLSHGERFLFGDVDFKRGPSQFDDFLAGIMVDHLAVGFWQRTAAEAERAVLVKIVTQAANGVADTPDETGNVLRVVCAAFGTSLAFLVK